MAVPDDRRPMMPRLPDGASEYKRTKIFDSETTPDALRRSHTTKPGVWGELVVLEGSVLYVLDGDEPASFVLGPGVVGVIPPGAPHHVEPDRSARFFVRFLRQ